MATLEQMRQRRPGQPLVRTRRARRATIATPGFPCGSRRRVARHSRHGPGQASTTRPAGLRSTRRTRGSHGPDWTAYAQTAHRTSGPGSLAAGCVEPAAGRPRGEGLHRIVMGVRTSTTRAGARRDRIAQWPSALCQKVVVEAADDREVVVDRRRRERRGEVALARPRVHAARLWGIRLPRPVLGRGAHPEYEVANLGSVGAVPCHVDRPQEPQPAQQGPCVGLQARWAESGRCSMAEVLDSRRDLGAIWIHHQPGQGRISAAHDGTHPSNWQRGQPHVGQPILIFLHGAPFNPGTASAQAGGPALVRSTHHRCADLYERAGVDLAELPLVGVGSVCRRQHTREVEQIMRALAGRGFTLHGFGVKITGLARYADAISSCDAAAWSLRGRRVPGCAASHRTESNCLRFALAWPASRAARADSSERRPYFVPI